MAKPRKRAPSRKREPAPLLVERVPSGGPNDRAVVTAAGCEVARRMLREGCPRDLVASVLGLDRKTLSDCAKRQPELDAAMVAGLGELEGELVSLLITSARDGVYAPAMFLLKTKFNYRETGPGDGADNRVLINLNLPAPRDRDEYLRAITAVASPALPGPA